jgi:hypothetical protein
MTPTLVALIVACVISAGMGLCLEVGRRAGIRRLASDPDGAHVGTGALEGAVFALLGLLIAFTFSGAASRFDARRTMIQEEANAIGTAWLRLDLLAPGPRAQLQDLFRRYLDSRLETYRKMSDFAAARAELDRSVKLQQEIWDAAVVACRESGSMPAHALLLPALNDMIDIVTTRIEAMKHHPPAAIFVMLGILALVASVMAGYGMAGSRTRSLTHVLGFMVAMTLTIYIIMDMEYPRFGLIRLDAADQVLVDLRTSMK